MGELLELGILVTLLAVGFFFGRVIERNHYASIRLREKQYRDVRAFTMRFPPDRVTAQEAFLVTGTVVVSADYFKTFVAGLRNLFEHLVTYKNGCEFYIVSHRFAGRRLREIQVAAIEHPASLQIVGAIRNGVTLMTSEKSFSLEETDKLVLLAERRADYEAFETSVLQLNLQPHTA